MQDVNWRERVVLLSTIVIAVLIALALAAIVTISARSYRAKRVIGVELGRVIGHDMRREAVSACVERRLDALAPFIDQAGESGRLTAIGEFGMPPRALWAATPPLLRNSAAPTTIAAAVATIAQDERRELDVWARLYTIVGPGRAIAPAEAASLREALIRARVLNREIVQHVGALKASSRIYEVHVARFDPPLDAPAICQPVGAVPEHYGRSPI